MISLLSKLLVNVFVVCFLVFIMATAEANQALQPVVNVEENSTKWKDTLKEAKGQSVYIYSWGS